jgi:hypothetical protein
MDVDTLALWTLVIEFVTAIIEPELWKVWPWLDLVMIAGVVLCNSATHPA